MCALDYVRTCSLVVSGVDLLHGSNVLDLQMGRSRESIPGVAHW
jgi:hypothetical protein